MEHSLGKSHCAPQLFKYISAVVCAILAFTIAASLLTSSDGGTNTPGKVVYADQLSLYL
jgi:hypothetical protein